MPPRKKGKGKRKSTDDNDETMETIASRSSLPLARKKPRSDTVTQGPVPLAPPVNSTIPTPPVRSSSRKKIAAKPRAATPAQVVSESDGSGSRSSSVSSASPPPETVSIADSAHATPAASLNAPSAQGSNHSNAARDVWHFFEKGNVQLDTMSKCRRCLCVLSVISFIFDCSLAYLSENIAKNPAKYGKINYEYAVTTGLSNLRYHLECHHEDEYVKICEENNWKMMLAKRRLAEEQNNPTPTVLSADASQLPFNAKNLLRALVKFVVADDQVYLLFMAQLLANHCVDFCSLSMFSSAVSFVTCFLHSERVFGTKIYPTARKFAKLLLLHGRNTLRVSNSS